MLREIPRGFRDFLPEEAMVRRSLEQRLTALFRSRGYREIIPPTLEFLDTVETGAGNRIRGDLFLMLDGEGEIMAMRPEMTVSIARMAATHMSDSDLPLRLFYSGHVFRNIRSHAAQYREFWQMGTEMIGAGGCRADAEIIGLAGHALKELNVADFQISLNHIGIFNHLLAALKLDDSTNRQIKTLIESKDMVELERLLERVPGNDVLKESIARLPVSHGGLEILGKVEGIARIREAAAAAEELVRIYELLRAYGLCDNTVIDTGVLRNLDYYTGVVFEGYSADLGYGLLGGGRYDRLLGQFGFECPATGFAIGMDRLALVSNASRRSEDQERIVIGGLDASSVIALAEKMRAEGHIVEIDVDNLTRTELENKIAGKKHAKLCYID